MITIHGDRRSGNCLKVLYVARHLGLTHRWVDVDVLAGETRTEAFLARNPAGQIPLVALDDGRLLAQSNAILLYLARDSDLVPADPYARALCHQWLFWEQYSHEPTIAVCRFRMLYLGETREALDPALVKKGDAALALMDAHLADRRYLLGDAPSVADVSLVAYTRVAHQGGFDLGPRPAVRAWIGRVEAALGIE